MSANPSDLPTLPLRLNALQVIGLQDPVDGDWAALRCLQYSQLHKVTVIRAVGHGIAALVTCRMYFDSVSPFLLAAWVAALVLSLANAAYIDRSFIDLERRKFTRAKFRRHANGVVASAVVWAAALLLFSRAGTSAEHMALWSLMALLMAGSVATMAVAPIATVIFAAIVGTAAMISFALLGNWDFVLVAAVFIFVTIKGMLHGARTSLSASIAEAGGAEKDEVVSLLLREFEENQGDWLWQIDTNRRVRSASPRFAYALGLELAEIEGQSFIRLVAGNSWEGGKFASSLHDLAERLKRRESFSNVTVQANVASGRRWWELSGTPILDDLGNFQGYRGVGSDVTERRESDEKIAYLARYDTLTGLPNRLMLTEAMGEALRYSEQWNAKCAFLMIDLDRFKSVNDSLGHQVGDKLLAQVSERLKSLITDNEQCGRLGGDEFAVVIRDASTTGHVANIAQSVIDALSLPYTVDNHTLYIGASVGSAVGPRDGQSVETLMRNADLALYRAKDEGGGLQCNYIPTLHAVAEERRKLELSLRHAIGNNELHLNFQPVVHSITEEVVSFEALLRWTSKEHGLVNPGKFIPLAEDTRLIVPIGEWVLYEACREAMRWPGEVRVAVNVSGEQLLEPDFSKTVVRALADTGLPAWRLEVEVTESIFLRDARTARNTLEEIMALGCSIALDDFGTGYSSLGYLRTLRFSTIKVDRSFVQGAAQGSKESLAIIRAVVAMAQSLEMTTTAEGVENAEEAAMVRELGCSKIQGYYFGRPMEAAEARTLVVKRRGGIGVASAVA